MHIHEFRHTWTHTGSDRKGQLHRRSNATEIRDLTEQWVSPHEDRRVCFMKSSSSRLVHIGTTWGLRYCQGWHPAKGVMTNKTVTVEPALWPWSLQPAELRPALYLSANPSIWKKSWCRRSAQKGLLSGSMCKHFWKIKNTQKSSSGTAVYIRFLPHRIRHRLW